MGLRFAASEDLPKQWSMRNRTSRWLRTSKSIGPTTHLSMIGTTANIPSATRLPTCRRVSEKLAHQSGPWFCVPALRLVCLFEDDDACRPVNTEHASAHVGQASRLTVDERCQARSLTYGSEDEFRAARNLTITCLGADVLT